MGFVSRGDRARVQEVWNGSARDIVNLRLLATVRLKNEEWILEEWLERTSEFVDAILALDDGSTDRSYDLLRGHKCVVDIIRKPPGGAWTVLADRNLLVDRARTLGAEWVHIIDPDELMDVRLGERIDDLLADGDAGRHFFREVTLWRGVDQYRVDKPELYARIAGTNQIVRMTPELKWRVSRRYSFKWRLLRSLREGRRIRKPVSGHEKLVGLRDDTRNHDDLVRLHYHFVDWERCWRNHVRYAAREAIQFCLKLEDLEDIVDWATARLDEEGLRLAPVKDQWGVMELGGARPASEGC